MAQQILKEVDGSFKSFFGLLKKAKQRKHALNYHAIFPRMDILHSSLDL